MRRANPCKKNKRIKDQTGKKYGRLMVVGYAGTNKHNSALWLCQCDCGEEHVTTTRQLTSGKSKSCGCLNRELAANRIRKNHKVTHRMSGTRFYHIWKGMIARCEKPKTNGYKNYGGRGIKVCEKWHVFENFMNDMHSKYLDHAKLHGEDNTSIDRIDVNGDYHKDNCRWETMSSQCSNRRKTKKYLIDNRLLSAVQVSREYNIGITTFIKRVERGWSHEEAAKKSVGG
ncbi:hypothetical protein L8C07_26415 [Paenibacillus sp. CMAA1739]|uniref:hypothetical protein n=1 Tax=Paenibacillus ottowii TaxID=2315729 RepID=UPI00272F8EAB|nr:MULTISPECIES: hypothetical protein [Paenibacillus]MDP1513110.1 hypothetical protein [Paenibacillus ottowii]MEC4569474.1 hypothetical protein [Paenibacillus sp. CMAA1739]